MCDYLLEIPIFFVNFYHPLFSGPVHQNGKTLVFARFFHYSAR